MKTERGKRTPLRIVRAIALGAGAACAVCAALCLLAAALVSSEVVPEEAIRPLGWGIAAVAAFAGCLAAQAMAGTARLPVSLGCAFVLVLAMLAGHAMAAGEGGTTWVSASAVAGSALLAALLGAKRRRRWR